LKYSVTCGKEERIDKNICGDEYIKKIKDKNEFLSINYN